MIQADSASTWVVLGPIDNPRMGQALIDYARGLGLSIAQRQTESGWLLLCLDTEVEQAQQQYQRFIDDPENDRYLAASWTSGDNRIGFDYGRSGMLQQLTSKAGPITLTVMALCIAIWAGWNLGFAETIFSLTHFPVSLASVDGQWWRIFTPSLIHFSAIHIVFNLLWWWQLGGKIERYDGAGTLLLLLLVAGTLPNVAQFYLTGPSFGGLSGVVYALVGYCWIRGWRDPNSPLAIAKPLVGFLLLWLLLGFTAVSDAIGINMANGAHLGGLLVGVLQGLWCSRRA
ncbi:rhomboid family intramembrane serine protease GlpG [Ferrimonas senticii]|uniref:rhomboid family intramembrane serine protease GlpG n=1 Tax=Ferrimonas senticii TaxID=394566 RepID=UPI00041DFB32|nr:rhomboid family intramembrane serine protease GlpG [Ferrimonas senticii]